MKNNKDIDDKIKSYEPLMHRVLRNYNVKEDYEDLLQEMRIVVWKALTDKNPKTMFVGASKFTTYLYKLMEHRLINIFKIEYKIRPEDKDKQDKDIKIRSKRSLARPKLFEDMSFEQQVNAIKSSYDADSIRLKTDIETFYNSLDNLEQRIWTLNLEGWTQEEIINELKKINISKNRCTISRKLKIINTKFTKFIKDGEL